MGAYAADRDPTPYHGVNAMLRRLLDELRSALGPDFTGLYLYGSLSSGDFDPASSDIDFVVATARELPAPLVEKLAAMHERIAQSGLPWSRRLEGWYIPLAALRRFDPAQARHPTIGLDWDFGYGRYRADWMIQLHIIRERGVVVWGSPPASLIDPITPDQLRAAAVENALGFWAAHVAKQGSDDAVPGPELEWLRGREYQAFAILTMCRILYTLESGQVASKLVAAAWAKQALDPSWTALIERALDWRHDKRPDDMSDMLHFIRFTVERCRRYRAGSS